MHRMYDMFPFSDMEMSIYMSISWIHRFVWMSPSMYVCLCIDLAVSLLVCVSIFSSLYPSVCFSMLASQHTAGGGGGGGINGLGKGGPCIRCKGRRQNSLHLTTNFSQNVTEPSKGIS